MIKIATFILGCCLSIPAIAQTVRINGTIKNTKDSVICFLKTSSEVTSGLSAEKKYKAKLDGQGRFVIDLPVNDISQWMIEINQGYDVFNLIPDENLNLSITCDSTGINSTKASGPHADNFNYFSYFLQEESKGFPRNELVEKIEILDIPGYLNLHKEIAAYNLNKLARYKKSYNLTKAYYKWLKTYYEYLPVTLAIHRARAKRKSLDSKVFDLLTAGLKNDIYAAKNSSLYNDILDYYMHVKFNGLKYPIDVASFIDFVKTTPFHSSIKQAAITRQMIAIATLVSDSLYIQKLQYFKQNVTDQDYVKLATKARETVLKQRSLVARENVSKAKLLGQIFKKYSGKIIYVDFWGSWCAPCRAEMANSAILSKKLDGKNIVFLYLGYKDDKEKWISARKDLKIGGEHYLLDAQMIAEANELFGIYGAPHYAIIGKDGTILQKNASWPTPVYGELEKLLKE